MANTNEILNKARKEKNDEFYTRREDIDSELAHYTEHFRNKTVLCNCDDPRVSNFFRYFLDNFDSLGLKRLISACYKNPDSKDKAFWMDYIKGRREINYFQGDGDFRSSESIELLKQADIVVTNPPFSLFREFVAQLIDYDKKFLIVGHQNAITYRELFPFIRDGKVWLGYGFKGGAGFFINTAYEDYAAASAHMEGMIRVTGVHWFTNLEIDKRKELTLCKKYNPETYPTYDNYNAIEVSKTKDIPIDYTELMGVPVSFLDKHNPDQFEIVDFLGAPKIKGKNYYKRLIIRKR